MAKGKKWTEGQDIGLLGENAFREVAARLRLIPQRVEQDVGIDFFCQPVLGGGPISSVSGHVVGACVRATRGKAGRIGLSNADAHQLLACSFPVLVVLVHLHKNKKAVYARLLDEELGVKLARAIRDGQESVTLRASDLKDESALAHDLEDLGNAAERTRLRMVSHLIREVIPSARLQVRRDPSGQLAIIEVPRLVEGFDVSTETALRKLHTAVFGAPSMLGERLSQLPMKQNFVSSLEYLPGPIVLGGGIESPPARVTVSGPSGTATAMFRVRMAPKKMGYVHDCGLSLTISERTLHEGRWVHFFESNIDENVDEALESHGALWEFLEKCEHGAKVDLGNGGAYDIERFPALVGGGYFARYLRCIRAADALPQGVFVLRDALSEEALQTMRWLSELARNQRFLNGFGFQMLDEAIEPLEPEPVEIPVVANLPRGSVVTWLSARVRFFAKDVGFVGLVIDDVLGVRNELRNERYEKRTMYPEVVVSPRLPSLQFSGGLQAATPDVTGWGLELKPSAAAELSP